MGTPVTGPAVELTITVRYPLPELDEDYSEFGIHSPADLVREWVEHCRADPAELLDLIEGDLSEVTLSFEIDDPDTAFEGGDHEPLEFASFHGLGEE